MITELVIDKTNNECGYLIESILMKSTKINQADKEEESESYSLLDIKEMLGEDQEININRLMRERVGFMKRKIGDKKVRYSVDLKEIKSFLMNRLAD